MNRLFVCAGLIAMAGAAAAGSEGYEGVEINVPGDYATIQDAIDNANPGDTICVLSSGPWAPFTVDVDGLTIKGADVKPEPQPEPMGSDFKVNKKLDQDNTRPACEELYTIDGQDQEATLITANGVTICGFSFVNGKDSHGNGGALKVTGSATLSYVCFTDNKADENGGAVFVGPNASVSINNATFANNNAEFGGAIEVDNGGSLSLVDVDFNGNTANDAGGAIDAFAAASITIEACCFEGNVAERGSLGQGGAIYNALSPMSVKNSVFCNNSASFGGGAIFSLDGDNDIWYSTFWNNTSLSGGGIEQSASPSTGSDPVSKTDITNSILVTTHLVNNVRGIVGGNGGMETLMDVFYSWSDQDLQNSPRVRDRDGNLGLDSLPVDTVPADMFVDAFNCDFRLVCDFCYKAPVIDAADSRACEDLCFDKDDNGRAIDKVDNPSTGLVDEGMENTGVDIWRRNHTCDAADMGAYEFKPEPFTEILVSCEGDTDFDGDVDIDDIFVVLRKFGYPCVISDGCDDIETDGGFGHDAR